MLIIPNHSDVPHVAIEALKEPGSEEQPLFQPGACLLETQRGRELTEEPVQLVDLTWTYVGHFTLPHFGQHAVPRDQVLGFMPGDSTCRPRLAEAQGLAADWLVSMDATTAQEYLTGEEFMDEGEDVDPPPAPEPEPQLVSQLQARIAELETRLQDRSTAVQPAPVAAPPQMKAPLLFPGGTPPNVSTADWAKLQTLAGSPPPRVSSAETRRKTVPSQVAQLEHAFADLNREADEAEEVNLELPPDLKTSDPMHRLMFLQMQQNSVLLKKLTAAKTQDPVLGALSGGGGGDSAPASSSGVKGCMARDAYVRAVQDLAKVSEVTRVNLLKELGIHSSQETGISASEVCGKEDSSGRASPPEPICLYDFRSLDDRFQQPERRVARDPQKDAFLRRTVCHRPRALSSSLAIDGVARTPVPNSGVREKANQPAAVLQTVPPGLDRSQPCFPQRSGLFREPRSSCAQTCEEQQTRRRRRSAEDQKAKTPERKRQRQRSGSATEFERHHRSVMQPVHRWHAQLSTMDGLDNFSPRDQVDNAKSRAQGQVDNPKSRAQGLPHTGSGCVLPDLTSSSAEQFCSFDLILHACRGFRNAPTGLGHFIRESLVPVDACTVEEASKPLWPVPLPRWRWTAQRLSPRRRRRQRFLKARHELLQVVIASLNWEVLGFPLTPPKTARLGSEFSSAQHQTVERLESMLDHFLRMPDFKAEDLGRAHDKFSSVINMVKELPKCQLGLEDLTELASQLKHDLDPYSSHFKSRPKPVVKPEPSEHACSLGTVKPPRSARFELQASAVKPG